MLHTENVGSIPSLPIMKLFNAFQLVAVFVGLPFFMSWLSAAAFPGHQVAFYGACAFYVVAFGFMVASVYTMLTEFN